MTYWKPYKPIKGKPHEQKNQRKNQNYFPSLCRICGKPLQNNANICKGCKAFIDQKNKEERKHK